MGKQILLMTRPKEVAQAFVAQLDPKLMRGVEVIHAPLFEIVPMAPPASLDGFAGVIMTSANGAQAAPIGGGKPAYCVGPRTAQTAKAAGFDVRITAQDADDLVHQLGGTPIAGPLIHLSGTHTRGDIAQRLTAAGIPTQAQAIYDQPLLPLSPEAQMALSGEVPVILPLFSPRTAAHLAVGIEGSPTTVVIALSEAVAQSLGAAQFSRVEVAAYPTGNQMAKSIENMLRHNRLS